MSLRKISAEKQKHKNVFVHTVRKIIYSNCVKMVCSYKETEEAGREDGEQGRSGG